MKRNIIFLLYCIALFTACKSSLSPRDYIRWVTDKKNGLNVSKDMEGYAFDLQYEPLAYVALREQYNGRITREELNNRMKERSDFEYFILSISTTDKKNDVLKYKIQTDNEYYARIQYFSSLMQQDLKLVENGNTLPCELFQFERDYNLGPFQKFVLGFPKGKDTDSMDKILVYEDKVLGVRKMELRIKAEDIKKVPALKID